MDAASVQPTSVRDEALGILSRLGVPQSVFAREGVRALSPITGELIAQVRIINEVIDDTADKLPAPKKDAT
jgi:hypothetical protein